MTPAATTANDETTEFVLQDKFDAIIDVLNQELVERRHEINAMVTALVAGTSIFLLGPPGVAKSMLVDRLNAYIDQADLFKILMSRFTTPDEVFGPVSLKGLENDEFKRKIEGYLATAQMGFLDEGFKANSAVLNALLWAINERQYRHDTEIIDIPLHLIMLCSNELPQDESLGALYDRLLFRFEVKPVRDQGNFLRMLRTQRVEHPTPILTWDEVMTAHDESKAVLIPDSVYEALAQLRKDLKQEGIEPTERRFVESMKIIRATAWLDGRTAADPEDLRPLEHVLWEVPEQQTLVSKTVLAIANPLDNEATELLQEIERLEQQLDKIESTDEKHRKGQEIHQKLRRAARDLSALEKRAGTSRRRSETIGECKDRLHRLTERTLTDVFGFDPNTQKINLDPA